MRCGGEARLPSKLAGYFRQLVRRLPPGQALYGLPVIRPVFTSRLRPPAYQWRSVAGHRFDGPSPCTCSSSLLLRLAGWRHDPFRPHLSHGAALEALAVDVLDDPNNGDPVVISTAGIESFDVFS
jgi:hypothetical protein